MKATNNLDKRLEIYLNKHLNSKIKFSFQKLLNKKEEINYSNEEETPLYEKTIFNESLTKQSSINKYIEKELDKNNFQKTLFNLIDTSGESDSNIYNKAYIDRRLFSKIRNDSNYHPSKNTVISLGLALNLDIDNFEKLLNSASYSLPKNNYFDLIIRFCINEKIYDIIDVNNFLDKYNCNTLN